MHAPPLVLRSSVLEKLGGEHNGDEEQALDGCGGEAKGGLAVLQAIEIDEAHEEAAVTRSAVLGDASHVVGGGEEGPTAFEAGETWRKLDGAGL